MKGDPALAEKWAARAAEWCRLADTATDPHIADVCRSLADQADTMRRFWQP